MGEDHHQPHIRQRTDLQYVWRVDSLDKSNLVCVRTPLGIEQWTQQKYWRSCHSDVDPGPWDTYHLEY